jgi:hypothetical protein
MSIAVPFLALSLFTFQNNFWVNLHQLLHAEAVRQRTNVAATVTTTDWTPAERDAWRSALDAYTTASTRDVVFDRQLVALNDALSAVAGDGAPLPAGLPEPSLVDALNRAAAAYRARLWPRHQQSNAAWISAMAPQVERHERALTQALAAAYRTPWPTLPIRVDVSIAAGRVGAYTTDSGPPGYAAHSTISPIGEGSDGAMGFEIIFHEASHAIDAHIMEMVRDECARQQVRVPGNLWHAIIFYTVGELVRRELGMTGDAHYMPYAYRFGVYDRGMSKERPALEQHWQPYLDGKIPFDEALRGLVRDAAR